MWYVYLLQSTQSNRTYIGSTTDVQRRLRQHNGEIVGGARSTSKHRPWRIVVYLEGFSTRSEACRWEKLLKLRCRGINERIHGFWSVGFGKCPSNKKKQRHYEPPKNLIVRHPPRSKHVPTT